MLVRLLARVPLTCHTSSQASTFLKDVPHMLKYPSLIPYVQQILQHTPSSPLTTILRHSDDFFEVTHALTLARKMKVAPSTEIMESHLQRRDVTTHRKKVTVPHLAQYFGGLQCCGLLQLLPTPEYLVRNVLEQPHMLHVSPNNCTLNNLADVLYYCKLMGVTQICPAIRSLVDAIPRIASRQKTALASLSPIYEIVLASVQYPMSNEAIKIYLSPLLRPQWRSKHVFSSNSKLIIILQILLAREAKTGTRFMTNAEYMEILTHMVDQDEKAEKKPSAVYLSNLLTVAFDSTLKQRVFAMLQRVREHDEVLTRVDIKLMLSNLYKFYRESTRDALHSILTVLDNVLASAPKDDQASLKTLLYFLRMQFYHGKWVQTTVSQLALQGDMTAKTAAIILSTIGGKQNKNTFPLQVVHAAQRMIVTSDIEQWSESDLLFTIHSCPLPLIRSLAPN
eukprot:PhF_6_TR8800/c0_g1_i5/m.13980